MQFEGVDPGKRPEWFNLDYEQARADNGKEWSGVRAEYASPPPAMQLCGRACHYGALALCVAALLEMVGC